MRRFALGYSVFLTTLLCSASAEDLPIGGSGQPGTAETSAFPQLPTETNGFTGNHSTGLMPAPASGPISEPMMPGSQETKVCAPGCDPFRYLRLEYLSLRPTAPYHKQALIELSDGTNPNLPVSVDIYRSGTVNNHFAGGFQAKAGRWINPNQAVEVGFLWLDPFFYKREFFAITTAGGAFGGGSSFLVTFLPTSLDLDYAKVYYQQEHWGLESNLRQKLTCGGRFSVDSLVGVRFHQIHERHNLMFVPPRRMGVHEVFNTGNNILGLQLGAEGDWRIAEYVSLRSKACWVAGFDWQWDAIRGPEPGTGLLTGAQNIGSHEDLRFGNFGDLTFSVVGHLTPHIETSLGFQAMAFGGIKRAASMFDLEGIGNPVLKTGQDWLVLYGFQFGVTISY